MVEVHLAAVLQMALLVAVVPIVRVMVQVRLVEMEPLQMLLYYGVVEVAVHLGQRQIIMVAQVQHIIERIMAAAEAAAVIKVLLEQEVLAVVALEVVQVLLQFNHLFLLLHLVHRIQVVEVVVWVIIVIQVQLVEVVLSLFPSAHHESIRHAFISALREMPISFVPYTAVYGPLSSL